MEVNNLFLLTLALIFLLWLIIILRITVVRIIRSNKKADATADRIIDAKVKSVETARPVRGGKMKHLSLTLEFPNFVGTPITQSFRFIDSQPELMRYEQGNRVSLNVNEKSKKSAKFTLSGGKSKAGKGFIIFTLALFGLYGFFIYKLYNNLYLPIKGDLDEASRFIEDESIVYGALLSLGVGLFIALIFNFVFGRLGMSPTSSRLLYYGKKASATIDGYKELNIKINDRPMVQFNYTFSTDSGQQIKGEDKMVISLLNLPLVHSIKERDVMYDNENTSSSMLLENISKLKMGRGLSALALLPLVMTLLIATIMLMSQLLI